MNNNQIQNLYANPINPIRNKPMPNIPIKQQNFYANPLKPLPNNNKQIQNPIKKIGK